MLADEINRASPKTQSALLEVMEEGHVTVDGVTHDVPRPFMVIATQNPIEQAGTYRLPEAQLDRFLMKTSVGYPDAEATEELLINSKLRDRASLVEPIMKTDLVTEMSRVADEVYVDRAVISYVRRLAEASREAEHVRLGISAAWLPGPDPGDQDLGRGGRPGARRTRGRGGARPPGAQPPPDPGR